MPKLEELRKENKQKSNTMVKEGLDMVGFVLKRFYKFINPLLILAIIGLILFGFGFETMGMMFLFVVLLFYVVPLLVVLLILLFLAVMLVKLYKLMKEYD